jgi:hypothetical protein
MISTREAKLLRGHTIVDAEVCEQAGVMVLRLRLQSGNIVAITPLGDGDGDLELSDQTAIPP